MMWYAAIVVTLLNGQTAISFAPHPFATAQECITYLNSPQNAQEMADYKRESLAKGATIKANVCMVLNHSPAPSQSI